MTHAYGSGLHPVTFVAGSEGAWKIDSLRAVTGESLAPATALAVHSGTTQATSGLWSLSGVASHARYVVRAEDVELKSRSPTLGRPEASCAALIPIKKSDAWWSLPQDTRREIFETRSRHIEDSLPYLPRVARRLYHARDLGQPFDFLTWFEFAPEHAEAFEELVLILRGREEWKYVEREVDIRLSRIETT